MATMDETPATDVDPWARYVLLMECRHFNRMTGNDPAARHWERDHAPEIARLEDRHPEFVMRFCQKALADAAAAAPDTPPPLPPLRRPRGHVRADGDFRSRAANDD